MRARAAGKTPAIDVQAYGNDRADLQHLAVVSAGVYVNGRPGDVLDKPSIRVVRWSTRGDGGTLEPQSGL